FREPAKRDAAGEQRLRDRLAAIATERDALQKVLAAEFPDYAALSSPQPLTVKDIQSLLSDDEALVLFSAGGQDRYVFGVTRKGSAWKAIPLGAPALADKVAAFRRGLDVDELRKSEAGPVRPRPRQRPLCRANRAGRGADQGHAPFAHRARGQPHLAAAPS